MEKKVRVCSLTYNTSRVRGACWSSKMGTMKNEKWVNYSHGFAKPNNKLVSA
jgi:hypothetical protein